MTVYTIENPTRRPKIGEPIREKRNGRWITIGKVRRLKKVKGVWEVRVR